MSALLNLLFRSLPVLALASATVILAGLFHYTDDLPNYWYTPVINDALLWIAAVVLLAGFLQRTIPRHAAAILTVLVALHLMLVVGILSSLTTLLLFGSSTVLGLLLMEWMLPVETDVPLLAGFCTGLALLLALFGVLIHYPLNYRMLYLILQLAPFGCVLLAGKSEQYGQRLLGGLRLINARLQQADFWCWVMVLMIAGYVARHAFYPTITYDDNALHLRLWTELTFQHMAAFDVRSMVWAASPFAVDMMHAVISLTAAADARAALNLVLLVLLLQQVWQMSGHFLQSSASRVLLLLLFASTPILGNLLITLQTELMLALLATVAVNLVLEMPTRWLDSRTLALLAIAALCCAIKLPGAVLGITLLASAVVKLLSGKDPYKFQQMDRRTVLLLLAYIALLAILAFNSYLTAWRLTGNPVFPLYNAIFQSPFYNLVNFVDGRWIKGFSLSSYWNMFFRTGEHYESWDFVAGFQYLLLLPLALLASWRLPQRRKYVLVLIPMLGFGVVMFAATQYWRYLFPVVPLASVVLAALLDNTSSSTSDLLWTKAAPVFALVSCLLLNFSFYPGISWVFSLSPQQAMTQGRRELLEEQHAPITAANRRINAMFPGVRVLYPEELNFGATLKGEPYYLVDWYAPLHHAKYTKVQNEEDIAGFLAEEQIDLVLWDTATPLPPESMKWQLGSFLAQRGFPEFQVGSVIAYRIVENDLLYAERYRLSAPQQATTQPLHLTADRIAVGRARSARYSVTYDCDDSSGYFIAQINWDRNVPYYRQVPCTKERLDFVESIPVPAGVSWADLYITVGDTQQATVSSLRLEMN